MRRYLEQIGSNKRRRVNKLDENNLSALHYAARYNHIEIVKLLIKHQAGKEHYWAYGSLHFSFLYFTSGDFWMLGGSRKMYLFTWWVWAF